MCILNYLFPSQLPNEDPEGEICAHTHVVDPFMQLYNVAAFYLFLLVAVVTYLTMFHKFWKNKTKLKELNKLSDEIPSISFQRLICNFRRDLTKSQIPVEMDTKIQVLQITNITTITMFDIL